MALVCCARTNDALKVESVVDEGEERHARQDKDTVRMLLLGAALAPRHPSPCPLLRLLLFLPLIFFSS